MIAYTHRINPHFAATHADVCADGWLYVTTPSPDYPIEIMWPLCWFKHQTLEAAEDIRLQLEKLTYEQAYAAAYPG
jgi:hypothetical protein